MSPLDQIEKNVDSMSTWVVEIRMPISRVVK